MMEPIAYALDPDGIRKLRGIAERLNAPPALSFDQRRDLANLLSLVLSQAEPLTEKDLPV